MSIVCASVVLSDMVRPTMTFEDDDVDPKAGDTVEKAGVPVSVPAAPTMTDGGVVDVPLFDEGLPVVASAATDDAKTMLVMGEAPW